MMPEAIVLDKEHCPCINSATLSLRMFISGMKIGLAHSLESKVDLKFISPEQFDMLSLCRGHVWDKKGIGIANTI